LRGQVKAQDFAALTVVIPIQKRKRDLAKISRTVEGSEGTIEYELPFWPLLDGPLSDVGRLPFGSIGPRLDGYERNELDESGRRLNTSGIIFFRFFRFFSYCELPNVQAGDPRLVPLLAPPG
jgi:hypothetical protein